MTWDVSGLTFKTKPALSIDLVHELVQRKILTARWVVADALYGDSPAFPNAMANLGL